MQRLFFICIMLCLAGTGYAQSFRISNTSKSKDIKSTDYVKLVFATSQDQADCCTYMEIYGFLESADSDSIRIRTKTLLESRTVDGTAKALRLRWNEPGNVQQIATSELLYLTRYSSVKNKKRRDRFMTFGGLLMVSGLGTAISSRVVSDQDSKRTLLLAGGLQLGTGLIMGLSARPKKRYFKQSNDPWRWGK